MLMNAFKTAAELGISEAEFESLFHVLGMLERGEISRSAFDMTRFSPDDDGCGTACCLAGWARIITPGIFVRFLKGGNNSSVARLFYPGRDGCSIAYSATPAQAAIALRSYLTTGVPRWSEALAA